MSRNASNPFNAQLWCNSHDANHARYFLNIIHSIISVCSSSKFRVPSLLFKHETPSCHTAMMMPQVPMPAPPIADPMQMAASQQALINQQAFLMVSTSILRMLSLYHYGVPQGSLLGPLFFSVYMLIIRKLLLFVNMKFIIIVMQMTPIFMCR